MRLIIERFHSFALRLLGGVGLLMALGVLSTIPRGYAADRPVGLVIAFDAVCVLASLALLLARFTPGWLRRPTDSAHALHILIALVGAFFFAFGPMAGIWVVGQDLPEPLPERYLAIALLPSAALSLLLCLSGSALAKWPAQDGQARQKGDPVAGV
ncbi:hypothetical protein [Tropicimonas sp. IMCC6043]|uniref:hypothetical protein n=1 Tax=Tropicimonas sp. IMCC6043 TaxID=2510645 RepID=UPI00101BB55E|nr:hypothetical protein [Tropicimonas sp. IMCC6043]RYH10192.1 hypothetical protein EU800_09930 [Tropicimonas sp. IMCC6043]